MNARSRRELVRAYKERKPSAVGVFAVRCASAGAVWVGGSRNIDSEANKLWFGLRAGGHINRDMQAAWTTHGQASFAFEILERIDDPDLTPMGRADLVKARERHWRAALGAKRAAG